MLTAEATKDAICKDPFNLNFPFRKLIHRHVNQPPSLCRIVQQASNLVAIFLLLSQHSKKPLAGLCSTKWKISERNLNQVLS